MKFYRIKFTTAAGTLWLSKDGTENSIKCQLEIAGVDDLLTTVSGIVEPSISGRPKFQTRAWVFNKALTIKVTVLFEAVWSQVVEFFNEAQENAESFQIEGTGDIGDFQAWVRPNPRKPFAAENFRNSRIKNITLQLVTVPQPD